MARYNQQQTAGLQPRNTSSTSGQASAQNTQGTQTQNVQSSNVSTTNQNQQTSGQESSRESFNIDYLDPVARQALNSLIQTLQGGGTPDQRAAAQQRLNEIATNQALRSQYSQANAFAQAQGAANAQITNALQQALPQIAASVDAAGTSGSAFSGLLTQQAATDAANLAAELGLQTSVQYGQIQAGLSGVLEQLTQATEDPSINALLSAINIAKGATESGVRNSSGSSSSTTTGTSTTVDAGSQQSTTNTNQTQTGVQVGFENTMVNPTNNSTKKTSASNNQSLNTPSANRSSLTPSATYQKGKTSYSQFG